MSEKKPAENISQRIAAVMRELRGVQKSSTNAHFRYKYAGHEAINEAVRPLFLQHGITQTVSAHGFNVLPNGTVYCMVRVRWTCTDNQDSFVEGDVPSAMPGAKGECTPQQCGSMLSYGTKNFTFKVLMLTDSNEPEADDYAPDARSYEDDGPTFEGEAKSMAVAYLGRFTECTSEAEVRALKEEIRSNWPAVRSVPNFGEHVIAADRKASLRIRNAKVDAQRQREPGEN